MSTTLDQGNRTFIGSVVFLDIVGYTKKSVSEQISMKDRFTSLLSESLKDIATDQRIILDTGDGAAITFLGDPEDALFVAMHVRDSIKLPVSDAAPAGVPLRIGINLGPVKLVRDINGQPNIVGDGINVAQRIMSFSPTGEIVVSRSYYDVVSVISDEYLSLFNYDGSRTDKHVRDHEIYSVGESAAAFKQAKDGMFDRAATTGTRLKALQAEKTASANPAPAAIEVKKVAAPNGAASDRKKFTYIGAALAVLVCVLALALFFKKGSEKPEAPASDSSASAAPAPLAAPAHANQEAPSQAPATDAAKAAPAPVVKAEASSEAAAVAPKVETTGLLSFSIQPWGEVFVDGKSIGVSPPMKQTKLSVGKHKVDIKNTSFPPFTVTIEIKPKENAKINHKF